MNHSSPSRSSRRRRVAMGPGVVLAPWIIAAAWLLGTAWYAVPGLQPASVPQEVSLLLTPEDYEASMNSHVRPHVFDHSGRVFVICGSSHAVKIEPALLAVFD